MGSNPSSDMYFIVNVSLCEPNNNFLGFFRITCSKLLLEISVIKFNPYVFSLAKNRFENLAYHNFIFHEPNNNFLRFFQDSVFIASTRNISNKMQLLCPYLG